MTTAAVRERLLDHLGEVASNQQRLLARQDQAANWVPQSVPTVSRQPGTARQPPDCSISGRMHSMPNVPWPANVR